MSAFELPGRVDSSWHDALEPVAPQVAGLWDFLLAEQRAGARVLPRPEHRWRALETPLDAVRVLILGQDPYPTPGHPIGLAFAVDAAVRPIPRSLANIYRELQDDLGIPPAEHGDLSRWGGQGVMLLNRVLTVRSGQSGSHRGHGWEAVTEAVVSALARRGGPLVAVLWGSDAQRAAPLLQGVSTIASAHPSPLSAHRGFFGSRPFSRVNDSLLAQGGEGIDWRLG